MQKTPFLWAKIEQVLLNQFWISNSHFKDHNVNYRFWTVSSSEDVWLSRQSLHKIGIFCKKCNISVFFWHFFCKASSAKTKSQKVLKFHQIVDLAEIFQMRVSKPLQHLQKLSYGLHKNGHFLAFFYKNCDFFLKNCEFSKKL